MRAFRWFELGQLEVYAGQDPDARLVAAIAHYHQTRQRMMSQDQQSEARKRG